MSVDHGASAAREFIAFHLSAQEYCVEVIKVREIRGWTPATPLPHAPPSVMGVINLRGMVLPIIDLASRMGFPSAVPGSRHAIMVVEAGTHVAGLLVDSVSEIFSVAASGIQPAPEFAGTGNRMVSGVISENARMIGVLSLDEIVALDVAA